MESMANLRCVLVSCGGIACHPTVSGSRLYGYGRQLLEILGVVTVMCNTCFFNCSCSKEGPCFQDVGDAAAVPVLAALKMVSFNF